MTTATQTPVLSKQVAFYLFLLGAFGMGIFYWTELEQQSVQAHLEPPRVNDLHLYRYQKDGRSWFYAEKVTRVTADSIWVRASIHEYTRKSRFDPVPEGEFTREEVARAIKDVQAYQHETGPESTILLEVQRP